MISGDDLWIDPGEYLVLAQYPERVSESGRTFRVVGTAGGWPRLNDSGTDPFVETVRMHDAEGVLVECVRYPPLAGEEHGRSIERFSEHCCAALTGGVWHRCASPRRATPGVENSIRTPPGATDGAISIRPNPFVRGVDRAAVISGACRDGETGFLVRIFDIGGREVRRLIGEEGGARIFTCRWDGSGGNGAPVTTGLYICLIEFVQEGGWVCRRERRSIAVGSR
jgi:hypothetical protein